MDLRLRCIVFKQGEKYYSIDFRPAIFGRVKDISAWESDTGIVYHPSTEIEIKPQNISAKEALKEFCSSILWDVELFLKRRCWRKRGRKVGEKNETE